MALSGAILFWCVLLAYIAAVGFMCLAMITNIRVAVVYTILWVGFLILMFNLIFTGV